MKTLTTTLLILAVSLVAVMATTVYAAEKNLDEASKSESHHHMGHMGAGHSQEMNDHMATMHAQMQAIHAEKDPEKRRILMEAHRQSMHEGMQMMHGMGGKGRMGMMHRQSGENDTAKKGKGKMDEQARMDHMEHRMDIMHKMMDQMMQHEDAKHRHMHSKE